MSVNTLEEGGIYKVVKRFTDCRGTAYEPGYTFTFLGISYWAYDGGYMLNCVGARIDFQETDNADLITNFASYVEKTGQSEARMKSFAVASPAGTSWKWWEIAGAVFLVVGCVFIVATERPRWSGAYVSAWIVLFVALVWGGYELWSRWRRK